jgi:integrase
VSAVAGLRRGDYSLEEKRARLRLHEKGGKEKLVWLHREAGEFLDAYPSVPRQDDGCQDSSKAEPYTISLPLVFSWQYQLSVPDIHLRGVGSKILMSSRLT